MITIIDYGLGNIKAFRNVYKQLDIDVKIAYTKEDLRDAEKLILPGVGAFDHAMARLNASGMDETLHELVKDKKKPVLGVCVGMQMLAMSSEEGVLPGLGWINGRVKKFDVSTLNQKTRLPHMGWNDVRPVIRNPLFNDIDEQSRFYFLHSYYFDCNNEADAIAITEYGKPFVCAVNKDNIYGVQFHPEKSHQWGIQLLKNFATI